ncbi:GntR family transcriptional regulator [Sporosarcina sp. NPDC096371]|uniref:GntR family transcriptional regulator n=1 Tax=Sporosarcina sp. NPDC096371 TaxID=3364530 RepID=UPI00381F4DAC
MSSTQPRRMSKDYAYYELKNKILNGVIPPDHDLVEGKLAEELDISKTPLREALQKLEVEELVIRQPNGRLKTASITVQEAEELFLVRSYLEGIIASKATQHATEEDIEILSSYCHRIRQAIKYKDVEEVLYYGEKFHNQLYVMSRNRTAVKILNQLNAHVTRYRRLITMSNDEIIDENTELNGGIEGHTVILEHIINGEQLKAENAMRIHIKSSMSTAIESIKKYEQNLIAELKS